MSLTNPIHEIGAPPCADTALGPSPEIMPSLASGALVAAAGPFPCCPKCLLPVKPLATRWFDDDTHEVIVGNDRRHLAAKTWRILDIFRSRPGMVFTHDLLLSRIEDMVGDARGYDAAADAIRRIRRAIAGSPFRINNVYGIGYRLVDTGSTR